MPGTNFSDQHFYVTVRINFSDFDRTVEYPSSDTL